MRDDLDFNDRCDHPDYTEYTNGANWFRSVGLPDNIGGSYKVRKIDIELNELKPVKSKFSRFILRVKRRKLKKLIDLNGEVYFNNFKNVYKLKMNKDDILDNSREAKYIENGILEGWRANKLRSRINKSEMAMNQASGRLDGWLYYNYLVFNTLLGVKKEDVYKGEYYETHIKEKQQYLSKQYLWKIKELLVMIDDMNIPVDSEKYNDVKAVYIYILGELNNKSASHREFLALEEVYNKLQEIYKECVVRANTSRGRVV